ncbi:MAG TPA: NUDIX domain-containing protein [Allosphingosinicella sp.]|nr:NUDIX domain-containing protein [Allosphingosinicella sp.]
MAAETEGKSASPSRPVIRIAAAIVVDAAGRTLLVRKRGTEAFMQPGGKIGDSELPIDALAREVREELGCRIAGAHRPLGRFSAVAANEADTVVEAELFAVELVGEIAPAAEIEEARWHHPDDVPAFPLAPLTRDHVLPLVRAWRQG